MNNYFWDKTLVMIFAMKYETIRIMKPLRNFLIDVSKFKRFCEVECDILESSYFSPKNYEARYLHHASKILEELNITA